MVSVLPPEFELERATVEHAEAVHGVILSLTNDNGGTGTGAKAGTVVWTGRAVVVI